MRNLSRTIVFKKATLIQKENKMKTTIIILLVIVVEGLGYGWLLGEQNEQLKTENAVLQQKISELNHKFVMAEVESSKLKWDIMLAKAGVPDESDNN